MQSAYHKGIKEKAQHQSLVVSSVLGPLLDSLSILSYFTLIKILFYVSCFTDRKLKFSSFTHYEDAVCTDSPLFPWDILE